jgi:hypothetical protein
MTRGCFVVLVEVKTLWQVYDKFPVWTSRDVFNCVLIKMDGLFGVTCSTSVDLTSPAPDEFTLSADEPRSPTHSSLAITASTGCWPDVCHGNLMVSVHQDEDYGRGCETASGN